MLKIGDYNKLRIVKEVEFGVYLDGDDQGEILLPIQETPKEADIDDELDVFIYFDNQARIIATTKKPAATIDNYAYLKVVQANNYGAFLDWGLPKDLFVPFKEQQIRMEVDRSYLVYIYLDHESGRLAASSRIDKFIDLTDPNYAIDEEVDLIVAKRTDLGIKVIVNKEHWGFVFENDIFQKIKIGEHLKGYVTKVRSDLKIDISLRKLSPVKFDEDSEKIFSELENNEGFLPFNDKSKPDEIYSTFKMSKKAFKKAIGSLYRSRRIRITDKGIEKN